MDDLDLLDGKSDGKHLKRIDNGDGFFRRVYRIKTDKFGKRYKGKVIKLSKRKKYIKSNKAEFQTWMAVKGTQLEQYFCPIRHHSDSFKYIIMDYADMNQPLNNFQDFKFEVLDSIKMYEKSVSSIPGLDIKERNVGVHKDRGQVLIDYSWGGNFNFNYK